MKWTPRQRHPCPIPAHMTLSCTWPEASPSGILAFFGKWTHSLLASLADFDAEMQIYLHANRGDDLKYEAEKRIHSLSWLTGGRSWSCHIHGRWFKGSKQLIKPVPAKDTGIGTSLIVGWRRQVVIMVRKLEGCLAANQSCMSVGNFLKQYRAAPLRSNSHTTLFNPLKCTICQISV